MGSGNNNRKALGYVAAVVAVAAIALLGRQIYVKLTGAKKAEDLFTAAVLPADKMAQIKLGMTYDQVKAITGEPIQKVTLADGSVRWDWMTSMVVFKDQKVTYAGLSHESKGGGAPGGSPAAPSSAPGGG